MQITAYAITCTLDAPFDASRRSASRTRSRPRGSGCLTTIDVQATMKQKLDLDVPAYVILGACNPNLASAGLAMEPDLGVLLPCNVVVRTDGDGRLSRRWNHSPPCGWRATRSWSRSRSRRGADRARNREPVTWESSYEPSPAPNVDEIDPASSSSASCARRGRHRDRHPRSRCVRRVACRWRWRAAAERARVGARRRSRIDACRHPFANARLRVICNAGNASRRVARRAGRATPARRAASATV